MAKPAAVWAVGGAYEPYVGRWSRLVAGEFVAWLGVADGGVWLDVGCGTGALSQAVLTAADPAALVGLDPSVGYLAYARDQLADPRVGLVVADARRLPVVDGRFDAVVSGLVLNFVPDPAQAVAEMARVTRPGGRVAAYVWDYAGRMELIRRFWDAAAAVDPAAAELDEGRRFGCANRGRWLACSRTRGWSRWRCVRSRCQLGSGTSRTTGRRFWAGRGRPPAIWSGWLRPGGRCWRRSCVGGCRWPAMGRSRWSLGRGRSAALPCPSCSLQWPATPAG